jgi:putative Mg2+ transporter-C (MgtC) family protein
MLERIVATVQSELSDLNDVEALTRVSIRLCFAALLGALIGYERERRESTAGLRTHMLVAVGCAVFVLVPLQSGIAPDDLTRVLQGVITGVGFLGAGAVLKSSEQGEIRGLTTAASIWATAAIGITVGLGREATAILTTLLVLFILAVLFRLETWMATGKEKKGR